MASKPGPDERVRCWAAAIRYSDGLADLTQVVREVEALYANAAPPPPLMTRPVVSVGRDLAGLRTDYSGDFETLVRAVEDGRACGVPEDVFSAPPMIAEPSTLEGFPANLEEAREALNNLMEAAADLNEYGDDLYHNRPSGAGEPTAPGKSLGCYGCEAQFASASELEAHEKATGHGA